MKASRRKPNNMTGNGDEEARDAMEEIDEEEGGSAQDVLKCAADADVCRALLDRYGRSSAPQHRHLCAAAAAMRSIVQEEGLPLTPAAYFAAAMTALSDLLDPGMTSALAAFLAILLPLMPPKALPPPKARDAAAVIASFLRNPPGGVATGTVRSMVKSLGFLLLCVDLEDWSAIEFPFETLLAFSVDRRPKVRRSTQICLLEVFKTLQSSVVIKKASKLVLHMHRSYIPLAEKLKSIKLSGASLDDMLSKPNNMEVLHMLNLLKVLVPYLTEKVRMKVLSDSCKLLRCYFTLFTRHVIGLLEVLVEHSKGKILVSESENIIYSLTSYISFDEKNPVDTVISASTLLKNYLNKLHDAQPTIWIEKFPLIFTSVAGYLCSDVNIAKHVADILKDLINVHVHWRSENQLCSYEKDGAPETTTMVSMCSVFEKMLDACDIPTEHILAVISVLFLKLGGASFHFMKDIVLKLSQKATQVIDELPNMKVLQECIGAALVAMGPEKLLSLIPISFNKENLTCSNTWLISILKKYMVGASLQYFMDHIVPFARSLQDACGTVKNVRVCENLQYYVHSLWDLLPSFCRYPTDISQSFESLAELLVVVLKENSSLHEIIATALQDLVNENRRMVRDNVDTKWCADPPSSILKDFQCESISFLHYSKKAASRNLKVLAVSSMGLLLTLTDVFFDSPPEKRAFLKEAIGCLASITGSANVKNFFLSLLEKFKEIDPLAESRRLEDVQVIDRTEDVENTSKEHREETRCLIIELASSLVKAADKDLTDLMFNYIRSSLMDTDGRCQYESYNTLSRILKEYGWFCSTRVDEIMDLLLSVASTGDNAILKSRLSCFHYLLVHLLKCNDENMNTRAFLILNEIILTLKSKKESRKLAYDVLLNISHDLKNSCSAKGDSNLQRLFTMVMGYLSSSSPHIMSGAISALSLLIYNDAAFCLSVPNLIPSVLVLLQNKTNEVIKAALGFVKVLVSSLNSNDLIKLLPDMVNGILPWSSVSKHHFRSKVRIILEILIRKCGCDAIDVGVPGKYKGFVKSIAEARESKKNTKGIVTSATAPESANAVTQGAKKRILEDASSPMEQHSKDFLSVYTERRKKKSRKECPRFSHTRQTARKDYRTQSSSRDDSSNCMPQGMMTCSGKGRRKNAIEKQSGGSSSKIRRKKGDKGLTISATASRFASSKFNSHRKLRNSRQK